jgi:hypothetical protein
MEQKQQNDRHNHSPMTMNCRNSVLLSVLLVWLLQQQQCFSKVTHAKWAPIKECIRPVRKHWEEDCGTVQSQTNFCHAESCRAATWPGGGSLRVGPDQFTSTDACTVVSQALLVEFSVFDVVLIDGGTCRSEIKQGNFTAQDCEELLPRDEEMVGLQWTGKDLLTVLEHGIDLYHFSADGVQAYPYTAGVRFDVDLEEPRGSRVSNVEILTMGCRWNPVQLEKVYHVLVNQFIVDGGYGYVSLVQHMGGRGAISPTRIGIRNSFWFYAQSVCTLRDPNRRPTQSSRPLQPKVIRVAQQNPPEVIVLSAAQSRSNRTITATS